MTSSLSCRLCICTLDRLNAAIYFLCHTLSQARILSQLEKRKEKKRKEKKKWKKKKKKKEEEEEEEELNISVSYLLDGRRSVT